MALTAKERVAKWRAKQRENPEAHEAYKQKERERNKRRKKEGQFKCAADMSARELRNTRRRWRTNSYLYRKRKQEMNNMLTPPTSPTSPTIQESPQRNVRADAMKRSIARRRNKERAKCYKENAKLKIKLKLQTRLTEKYKKRFQRQKKNHDEPTKETHLINVNNKKVYKLYETVINNIRMKYQNSRSQAQKRMIASLVTSKRILKQYRIGAVAQSIFAFSRRHLKDQHRRKPHIKSLRVKEKVVEFFERDDVSRMKPDKQSTITRKGIKKQLRLLTDDLRHLHMKYNSENMHNMSYSLFCRLRPFWVIKPREKDRQTCMCRIHDNLNLKLKAAHAASMIKTKDINKVVKTIVCDENNKACMYRECTTCGQRRVGLDTETEDRPSQVEWYEWKTRREEVSQNDQAKIVTKVMKSKEQGSREVLAEEICKETHRACRHIFNIRHQYKSLQQLKSNLTEDDLMIHIDFSENYTAKYAHEIQSMHFGGSRNLISLHTGVMYLHDGTYPFCTVSDNLRHDPSAIWAHLHPVLKDITSQRKLNSIHFISDGPTTQYRNKHNFFLWGHKVQDYGFKSSTWNFLEASHGKGAADGIGAAVKRAADQEVLVRQKDITTAEDFVTLLTANKSNVKFYIVKGSDIDEIQHELPKSLQAIPGTMKIHQLVLESAESFSSRVVSCFCSHPTKLCCGCFDPCSHRLHPIPNVDDNNANTEKNTADHECNQTKVKESGCELESVSVVDESLVGKFVVVLYDDKPFTGVVQAVDEDDIEVKAMHTAGLNRFYWPLLEDVCWYHCNKVVTVLSAELERIGSRHWQIQPSTWRSIMKKLDM